MFSQILAEHNNIVYGYDVNPNIKSKIKNNNRDTEPNLNNLIIKREQ